MSDSVSADEIVRVADGLGVPAPLVDDALAYLDARTRGAVAAQVAALESAMGTGRGVAWPSDDVRFQLLALLGAVPAAMAWFARAGIDDTIAADSLADLTPKLRDYGIAATGIDWLAKVVTCGVFTIGRLQFEPAALDTAAGLTAWNVHVPESGPLDPASCDDALARAVRFFRSRGDRETRAFVCHSWLLDDQLAGYLPGDSNIVRFGRRFTLVDGETTDAPRAPGASGTAADGTTDGDHAVAKFVFKRPLAELPAIVPITSLERAVLAHLAAGGHWRERSGVLRLP